MRLWVLLDQKLWQKQSPTEFWKKQETTKKKTKLAKNKAPLRIIKALLRKVSWNQDLLYSHYTNTSTQPHTVANPGARTQTICTFLVQERDVLLKMLNFFPQRMKANWWISSVCASVCSQVYEWLKCCHCALSSATCVYRSVSVHSWNSYMWDISHIQTHKHTYIWKHNCCFKKKQK